MLAGLAQGRASVGGKRALLWLPVLVGLVVVLEMAGATESQESNTAGTESPETVSPDLSRVSPQSSWLFFRKNSNKGDNKRGKPTKRVSKHGLPGPPGPPGPQGPPGPPAPLLPQQQQLIEDLHLKLKEMAGGVCTLCDTSPRVSTAFHSRLQRSLAVPRRSLLELQPYSQPSDSEQRLQRGLSFNSSTGRYTAPLAGFYQLTASLLIEAGDRAHTRQRDSVRASICIESLCQGNVSVESVTGLGSNGGVFSILLTGTLYLQEGEYVSVFVDNGTGSAISVLQDSMFSGILLGV